eukprot:GFYU01010957.1.p1 GENE.GFYU01010957.1~~GFYU01010957.1.p1  ORF type:complete len:356 (-),score=78.61 GFYU01010957.1:319-1386(-)
MGDIDSTDGWRTVFKLIGSFVGPDQCATFAFDALAFLIMTTGETSNCVNSLNFRPCLETIMSFVESEANLERSMQAIDLIAGLHPKFCTNPNAPHEKVSTEHWRAFWIPMLHAFAFVSRDHRHEVRNYAITRLQRALLSPEVDAMPPDAWAACFTEVLFPLVKDILDPADESLANTPEELEKTWLRIATMLSKLVLQHMTLLVQLSTFDRIVLHLLSCMEQFLKRSHGESLVEAIPEMVKNMLLVMSSSGLVDAKHPLWEELFTAVDRFCSDMRAEIMPTNPTYIPPQQPAQPEAHPPASPAPAASPGVVPPPQVVGAPVQMDPSGQPLPSPGGASVASNNATPRADSQPGTPHE